MSEFLPFSESLLKFSIPLPRERNNNDHSLDGDEDSGAERSDPNPDSLAYVLDRMYPPKTWKEEDDLIWTQRVSTTPATRNDSISLQYQLNDCLQRYQAHESGVCSLRRELYDNCFDELIRQITVNCIDQGLLLYRIRNEFRLTLGSYATIYESSVNFGLRQALRNEERVSDIQLQKDDILIEKQGLQDRLSALEKLHQLTQGKNEETLNSVVEKYDEKIAKLNLIIDKQRKLIEALNRKPIQL